MIKPKSGKEDHAIWSEMDVSHPPMLDIDRGQAKKKFLLHSDEENMNKYEGNMKELLSSYISREIKKNFDLVPLSAGGFGKYEC